MNPLKSIKVAIWSKSQGYIEKICKLKNGLTDVKLDVKAWRANIESQVAGLKIILTAVHANQIELASRGAWMVHVDDDLVDLNMRLTNIESNRYTAKMADKSEKAILREIDMVRKIMKGR